MRIEEGNSRDPNRSTCSPDATAAMLTNKIAALRNDHVSSHHWIWWVVHTAAWICCLGLLSAALLRIFFHDGTQLLTWINAFTPYFYLPAYACAVWAIVGRRWILMTTSLVVIGFHLTWVAPDFLPGKRVQHATLKDDKSSRVIRIFFANVKASKRDFGPLWREIEIANPDIVIFAESNRHLREQFQQHASMTKYMEITEPTPSWMGDVRIYSRLPITGKTRLLESQRVIQQIDLDVDGATLCLVGLHAPRPQLPDYDYFGFWQKVVPWLLNQSHPLVVIGDFNATQHSLVYKQLEKGGLRSAHEDRGRGYAVTWPNGTRYLPPIRIDQVFLSPDVECLDIREGEGDGSDHKPVVVDLRILRGKESQ